MKRFVALMIAMQFALTFMVGIAVAKPHENNGKALGLEKDKQEHIGKILEKNNNKPEDKIKNREKVGENVYGKVYGQNVTGAIYGLPFKVGNPNQPVKSLEGLVLVMKAAGLTPAAGSAVTSKDFKKLPVWGRAWVKLAIEKGLLTTKQLKKFNPNQGMKWGELTAYCNKLGVELPKVIVPNVQRSIAETVFQSVYQTVYQSVYQSVYDNQPPVPAPIQKFKANPNMPVKWFMVKHLVDKAQGK